MLNDIVEISTKTLDKALRGNKKLQSPIIVYDLYRRLSYLIDRAKVVANHYLALELTELFLQNSSFGEPIDKWRYFLNQDLKKLNKSAKKYLHKLSHLAFEDNNGCFGGIMSKYYNPKTYYGFIRDEYSVGFIEPCSSMLYSKYLDTKAGLEDRAHICKFSKIDLSSYEGKKELQQNILQNVEHLNAMRQKLQRHIKSKYYLQDLL